LKEIESSKNRLGVLQLEGVMLHHPNDFYTEGVWEGLMEAKSLGWVKSIGISLYDEEDLFKMASMHDLDLVQIPYNVFDQRIDCSKWQKEIQHRKIRVFGRSPLLQGLFLMKRENIPKPLWGVKKYSEEI
jgi:aryl-alcohol dehydrogenase-like predicted oxidoreductase